MTDRLAHRGPDDRGVFIGPGGALGHRRLTILDLVGGQQPMVADDTRSALVYNGELYNYLELRDQWLGDARLRSTSDTEVLLQLLTRRGADALPDLNGMFAFAWWDIARRKVLLARDPAGQKPLYYHHGSETFVFASELSSLAIHPDVPLEIDPEALSHYLLFESFPHPMTPIAGVNKLEPGHFLELDLARWTVHRAAYWDDVPGTTGDGAFGFESQNSSLETFAREFQAAVGRHMRSDVPIGIFLSGGLDSPSLVKAAAAERGGEQLQTFTIRHEDPSFDESAAARSVAELHGTVHRERLLRSADFEADVIDLLGHADEPVADPGMLAIYQVIKFSREFVKVVLSGNGGDEFFAGYAPFRALSGYRIARAALPVPAIALLQYLASLPRAQHGYMNDWLKLQRFLRGVPAHPAELLMRWIGAFDRDEARAVLRDGVAAHSLEGRSQDFDAPILYEALYREHSRVADRDPVTQLLHMFQRFFLPCCICSHSDKASMKLSQELRSPFLDTRIMRFANRLPSELKYHRGQTKVLIRRYLADDLDGAISSKTKQGFTIPVASWLTSSLRRWADERLDPQQLASDGFFDPATVRRLWDEHQSHHANHAKALWTILVFQEWLHTSFHSWRTQ
jgi:asparagine synthase (glutamine-hydrolysing)